MPPITTARFLFLLAVALHWVARPGAAQEMHARERATSRKLSMDLLEPSDPAQQQAAAPSGSEAPAAPTLGSPSPAPSLIDGGPPPAPEPTIAGAEPQPSAVVEPPLDQAGLPLAETGAPPAVVLLLQPSPPNSPPEQSAVSPEPSSQSSMQPSLEPSPPQPSPLPSPEPSPPQPSPLPSPEPSPPQPSPLPSPEPSSQVSMQPSPSQPSPPLQVPGPSPLPPMPEACSMLEVVRKQPGAGLFIQALEAAGMSQLLDDPALVATIFVPQDSAWEALREALNFTKEELFTSSALQSVMQYHIIPGIALKWADLALLPYLAGLPSMYHQQPVKVYNKFGSVKVVATSRQIGSIVVRDISSCLGGAIVHMIDVVLPPDPSWHEQQVVAQALPPSAGPTVQLILPGDQQAHTPAADEAVVKAFGGSG